MLCRNDHPPRGRPQCESMPRSKRRTERYALWRCCFDSSYGLTSPLFLIPSLPAALAPPTKGPNPISTLPRRSPSPVAYRPSSQAPDDTDLLRALAESEDDTLQHAIAASLFMGAPAVSPPQVAPAPPPVFPRQSSSDGPGVQNTLAASLWSSEEQKAYQRAMEASLGMLEQGNEPTDVKDTDVPLLSDEEPESPNEFGRGAAHDRAPTAPPSASQIECFICSKMFPGEDECMQHLQRDHDI